MEGLAFPLCVLRSLCGTYACVPTPAPPVAHGLLEGVVSVLLHKHVRHKGLGTKGLSLGGDGSQGQQQQLMMPSSASPTQVCCTIMCPS